jgi:4'-phosphopantetheinyl transferase
MSWARQIGWIQWSGSKNVTDLVCEMTINVRTRNGDYLAACDVSNTACFEIASHDGRPSLSAAEIWRDSANSLHRLGNSVHLWRVRLDRDDLAVQHWTALLTQEERDRASRYRFDGDRNRFIIRRWKLRNILASYLRTEPQEVKFQTGKFGRLELADPCHPTLCFSVTHSDGVALIAVARTRCIGVDLEHVKPLPDLEMMIDKCLSYSERCHIQALPRPLQLECFYRYWTCKEAYLKARGTGLNRSLDSIQVSLAASGLNCRMEVEDREYKSPRLFVWSSVPLSGYVAATATAQPQHELFAI